MQLQQELQTSQPSNLIEVGKAAADLFYKPLEFVMWAYPWEKPGVLAEEEGPDDWQAKVLLEIGEKVQTPQALYKAIKSGHEVGKTTLAAWIIHWFIVTRPYPQIVSTANTKTQLETKLWREVAKWHNLSRVEIRDKYIWTATKFYRKERPDTWFAAAIPWSKDKPDAFQGTHEKYTLIVYDESSTIDDVIWEATDGSISERGIWLVTGNPTLNTGRFYECFHKFRHRWLQTTVDSRTSRHANQKRISDWIDDYGEDSDFVRIRVKGIFPRTSTAQFIPVDLVEAAVDRKVAIDSFRYAPILIGVDVARFGDDQTVILVRQGEHIHDLKKYREKDTMQVVGLTAEAVGKFKPQGIFVDSVGIGSGVVDRLRQLGYKVIDVNSGRNAINDKIYHNRRAEMWGKMRDWLETGSLPVDQEMQDDLIGPEYGFDKYNRYQLEKKEDMKSRGLASPNCADALALTFALPTYSNEDIRLREELMHSQHEEYPMLDPEAGI